MSPTPKPLPWLSRKHAPLIRGGTEQHIRHVCGQFNLAACNIGWTCHDYLTIVSFGEHWVSLKLSNAWFDRKEECEVSSALEDLLYDLGDENVSTVFQPTQVPQCYNVDLRQTTDCIACTLLAHASQTRRRRHKSTSQRKAERRARIQAKPICHA